MTSGVFELVDPHSIVIDREGRQRQQLDPVKITELAMSIRQYGLINPPTVDREYNLVAGEHRVLASREAGLTAIPVQFIEDLTEDERHAIELEENIRRTDLAWQDQVRAIEKLHQIKYRMEDDWSVERTGRLIGYTVTHIRRFLDVAKFLDDERVATQDKLSTAFNVVDRLKNRQESTQKKEISSIVSEILTGEEPPVTPTEAPEYILNEDFAKWGPNYAGHPFNFIHCDFPYGVKTGDKSGQSAAKHLGKYDDSYETFISLSNTLAECMDNLVHPQSHMIFWFSMTYYEETRKMLEAMGWTVQRRPLIWGKSDNTGIIPDPNRGPRWIYETAFFCTRGDRRIARAVGDCYWAPTTKLYHTSEKSYTMLQHFLRMVVDETTDMFDPTAGSGMAVKASIALGARRSLGLELDSEFAEAARLNIAEQSLLDF